MIISAIRAVTPLKLFVGFHTKGKIEAMSDVNLVSERSTPFMVYFVLEHHLTFSATFVAVDLSYITETVVSFHITDI